MNVNSKITVLATRDFGQRFNFVTSKYPEHDWGIYCNMKQRRKSTVGLKLKKTILTCVVVSGTFAAVVFTGTVSADNSFEIKNGELKRPTGYREWIYVGTPVTPNDLNNGKAPFPEHHNVYIDPRSWAHWKETGEFRDGTILIKELVSVGSKVGVSGNGYFQGEFIGLEATIKSKKHFPNEPGNWAYYSFSTSDHKTLTETAKPFATASCNACHAAAAQDDFVFTQYYPVLNIGKGAGVKASGGFDSDLKNNYLEPTGE